MFFITSRMPTVNMEPGFNKNFVFNLGDNSSGREIYCCRRDREGVYEEIDDKNLLAAIKASSYRQVLLSISTGSRICQKLFSRTPQSSKRCVIRRKMARYWWSRSFGHVTTILGSSRIIGTIKNQPIRALLLLPECSRDSWNGGVRQNTTRKTISVS